MTNETPGTESNSQTLVDSAATFARSGLAAYHDGGEALFFLHAATSMEQLLKAHLHSQHPAMIREVGGQQRNLVDLLLHASGHAGKSVTPLEKMRTITASEALARSIRLIGDLKPFRDDLLSLFDVRNGIVHAGELRAARKEAIVAAFLRATQVLIAVLKVSPEDFWESYADNVQLRINEHAKEVQIAVSDAITKARETFKQRFGDGADYEVALRAIESTYDVDGLHAQTVECPSCGRLSLLSGDFDVDWDIDVETDLFTGESVTLAGHAVAAQFQPHELTCRICSLSLEGLEQLQAAEVPWLIELEDEDVERAEQELVEREYAAGADSYHDYSDDWR